MKLIGLTVENFRCYAAPISVRFGDAVKSANRTEEGAA